MVPQLVSVPAIDGISIKSYHCNSAASPFVIALANAKIPGLNRTGLFTFRLQALIGHSLDLVNATICVSVLSIGLSCVYDGS